MGFLDYLNNPQSSFQQDALPNWLTEIMGNPQMMHAMQPQGGAELPPDKQPAGPMAQPMQQAMPQAEPRRSIFSPPDTYDGAPPLDRPNPFGAAQPQPQPMQAPGMSAMAQAPMPQGQPGMGAGQPNGFIQGLSDNANEGPVRMLWGGLTGALGLHQPKSDNVTVNTLMKRGGFDRETAMAIKSNPAVLTQVMTEILGASKGELKKTGTDPITGQDSFQVWNPRTKTLEPVKTQGGGAAPGPQSSMLAPGVAAVDHSLSGDDYLNQFGPEVQAAVKAYIKGDVMPTGNPRLQGVAAQAKIIAQKYGADTGIPVSDSLYSQRRTYRSQLGSNSPNSAGGSAKAFNQGIEHMGALAETLEKLDNSNGMGIPWVAKGINYVRQGASTEQAAIADKASAIGQTLAGEVGKLFSGSAGGGVHERQLTRDRFDTITSKPQLAAALEATLEVMRGGLTALEQRRDEVLGPNSDVKFITKETEEKIAKIEGVIERLKKGESPAPADAGSVEGKIAIHPNGTKIIVKDGKWVPYK